MASDRIFDVAVIGLGAVGSASLYQFARRGHRVLGLDRWNPPHSLGSSHGSTRITRCAVGEGDGYVPLVRRTHQIWREIEAETGQDLLTQCGALVIAAPGNAPTVHGKQDFFRRTVEVARRNAVPHDLLDAVEVRRRFPQFQLADDEMAFFEPSGGYVRPERCIAAQLGLATQLGAQVRPNMHVTQLARSGAGVRITTAGGDWFEAAKVVLAAGAWSPKLAGPAVSPLMTPTRQVLHWFEPREAASFSPQCCPVYIWMHGNGAEDSFYGFPLVSGDRDVKVATEQYRVTLSDADALIRRVSDSEAETMFGTHLRARLPGLRPHATRSSACLYTMTPDAEFLVSHLPDNDRVLLVSACSGHGFKHSAALGEAVAELVSGTADTGALSHFGADRPSLALADAG